MYWMVQMIDSKLNRKVRPREGFPSSGNTPLCSLRKGTNCPWTNCPPISLVRLLDSGMPLVQCVLVQVSHSGLYFQMPMPSFSFHTIWEQEPSFSFVSPERQYLHYGWECRPNGSVCSLVSSLYSGGHRSVFIRRLWTRLFTESDTQQASHVCKLLGWC